MLDSPIMSVNSILCTTCYHDDHSYPKPIWNDSVKRPAGDFRTGHHACLEVLVSKVITEKIGNFTSSPASKIIRASKG